ncbi:alpha/beta fold hydrolase [Planomonospora venezuelensis]|uniref:Pimeloyl-ACP methyl ester carboxylesterase n=1 Tax=Planomonospora venezuelensis TaxID=1999 RepID=A0A841D130_PLAVE|nr:alpha/beta hydrolase [Planomonospora venezuelensis]MBB5963951.1 pimeloyl-ACP methyl ester carboxylesterase [Planomonospora venezuelensis]GIN03899.1 alpha/beta hydrolase [Planomonospora venezuelensis]
MKLNTREWGSGDRVAVLIHGIMASSLCWWRVGPVLAERGYRVVAVDLPGHGDSPRSADPADYTPEALAASVLESVPAAPELAVGHSLGGLVLGLAVERLRPGRAIYSDPAFRLPAINGTPMTDLFVQGKNATREQIAAMQPGWPADEVEVELEMLKGWDTGTALALGPSCGLDLTPGPVVPSMVQLADPSFLVPPDFATELKEKGFEVRTVTGAGHTIHRHLYDDFMASVDDWL